LLSVALSEWSTEHATLCERQFAQIGVDVRVGADLHCGLIGSIPDQERIESVLAMPRKAEVRFVGKREGPITITVEHGGSGAVLRFSCDLEISYQESEVTPTTLGLLKQSFQATLVAGVNRALARRIVRDSGYDEQVMLGSGGFDQLEDERPVFSLVADSDLARALWQPEEVSQGFRILRGSQAAQALRDTPAFLRPNAAGVDTTDFIVQVFPFVKVNDHYRAALQELVRQTHNAMVSPSARVVGLLTQSAYERDLLDAVDALVGMEIGAQAAKDASASAYQRRVGADPDAIKERARNHKALLAAQTAELDGLRAQLRTLCSSCQDDDALLPAQKNAVINAQASVLAALRRGNSQFAVEALQELIEKLPPQHAEGFEQFKVLMTSR
jgi:hypothetical protein